MTLRFEHETQPQRVLFGSGDALANVVREVKRLGAAAVMVIASATEQQFADQLAAEIPVALRYSDIVMHVPVEVADKARTAATEHGVDLLLCVGGGSTTGLAKAIALTTGLPIIAVPTTYAGSEATNVWGLTEGGTKTTGVDARVLPGVIVYDAALTLSLPVPISVASGLNALAHCVDSMWAPRTDPIDQAIAAEGIRALRRGLPAVLADPSGLDGREHTLYGAYLSAVAFASAGSGLHHKICHVLGGKYDLPHAQTHAIVLPYVLAFNAPGAPDAERRHRRGIRRRPGHRRPAGPADPARRATGAAGRGFSPRGHSRGRRRHPAGSARQQSNSRDDRQPAATAAGGLGWS